MEQATVLGNDKETVETQTKIFGSFSPSDSFLIFAPPADYPRPASCGSGLPLKLYFTADKEVNFDLHYIVGHFFSSFAATGRGSTTAARGLIRTDPN